MELKIKEALFLFCFFTCDLVRKSCWKPSFYYYCYTSTDLYHRLLLRMWNVYQIKRDVDTDEYGCYILIKSQQLSWQSIHFQKSFEAMLHCSQLCKLSRVLKAHRYTGQYLIYNINGMPNTHIHLPLVNDIEIVSFITCMHKTILSISQFHYDRLWFPLINVKLNTWKKWDPTLQNNRFPSDVGNRKHCIKYVTGKEKICLLTCWTEKHNYPKFMKINSENQTLLKIGTSSRCRPDVRRARSFQWLWPRLPSSCSL